MDLEFWNLAGFFLYLAKEFSDLKKREVDALLI